MLLQLLLQLLLGIVSSVTPNLHPIKCINFYGLETERRRPVCDWSREPDFYLKTFQDFLGVNTIRVPFSYQLIHDKDFTQLDQFINTTTSRNIQVILDYHRTWQTHQGASPMEGVTISMIADAWHKLAARYYDNPYVIGLGVFNEYQYQNMTYLNLYHESIIRYVEHKFPDRYYYFLGCADWSHDCRGIVYQFPGISPDRVMVEYHAYHFIFNSTEKEHLEQSIDFYLPRSIPTQNIIIGELGWKQDVDFEVAWAKRALNHFRSRGITSLCAWTVAHSHDTAGFFKDDCLTFDYTKASVLKSYWENQSLQPTPPPAPTCPPCNCPQIPWVPSVPWPSVPLPMPPFIPGGG
jgi:hypothetical protein